MSELRKGGDFLNTKTEAKDIFIPEELDEEQKMIPLSAHHYIENYKKYKKLLEVKNENK